MQARTIKARNDFGVVVPPRSGDDIESTALDLRKVIGLKETPYFPIVPLYDLLHVLVPGASYDVLPKGEMGNNYGLTRVRKKVILIREDVFEDACRGDGRGRFTMCHELGHLLLHRGGLALQRAQAKPPMYMSSEWQSDRFAGALLMPSNLLSLGDTPADLMWRFGVSFQAASVRISQFEKMKGVMKQAS